MEIVQKVGQLSTVFFHFVYFRKKISPAPFSFLSKKTLDIFCNCAMCMPLLSKAESALNESHALCTLCNVHVIPIKYISSLHIRTVCMLYIEYIFCLQLCILGPLKPSDMTACIGYMASD